MDNQSFKLDVELRPLRIIILTIFQHVTPQSEHGSSPELMMSNPFGRKHEANNCFRTQTKGQPTGVGADKVVLAHAIKCMWTTSIYLISHETCTLFDFGFLGSARCRSNPEGFMPNWLAHQNVHHVIVMSNWFERLPDGFISRK